MKVLNFGSCNIDYVYLLDHIVNAGETESADTLSVFSGGKGLNQSIAAARAGIPIAHAGCIGEDGEFLAELLKNDHVDITHLKRTPGKTGHAMIQVSKRGENAICIYPGSNAEVTCADIDKVLACFDEGDMLLLQNEISNVPYLVEAAHKKGMRILLNPSPMNETIAQLDLSKLSYLILNEIEAVQITGAADPLAALALFRRKYPELSVVLTLGKDGSIYQDSQIQFRQPSFIVEAVDTTAAGDTFTGYFIAGIIRGEDIPTTMVTASCASAISVSRSGAAPSIPHLAEVKEALSHMQLRDNRP
jgi:ribokinase